MRFAALRFAAYEGGALGEPADHVEPVEHVFRVAEVGVDGGLVGLRSVGHDDLDAAAPAWAVLDEERFEGFGVAVLDHGEDLAGLAVLDHGDVAVPFTHRGLIDQQHPTPAGPAVLGHQRRPRGDE